MAVEEVQIHPSRIKSRHAGGLTFVSAYDFDVTDRDMEKARDELNESEEIRTDCLKQLKEMLEGDEVYLYQKNDKNLLRYLRHCKFDCKRAHSMVQKSSKFRTNHPELFDLPSNFEYILNTGMGRYMPYRDADGCVVSIADFRRWDIEKFPLLIPFVLFNAVVDIFTQSPHSQIHGYKIIVDVRGLTANHYVQVINPKMLYRVVTHLQGIHAFRMKRIIGFNCNALLRTCYYSFKFLLKKKVADRVVLLGSDTDELHQYVNPEILPKDYGGALDDEDCSITEFMMENLPYLKSLRTFGSAPK